MKPNGNELKVIHGNRSHGIGRSPSSRMQLVAAAVGLAVLLVGGASTMPRSDADQANTAAAHLGSEIWTPAEPTTVDYFPEIPERVADRADGSTAQPGAAASVYFPAQYENQAREKEEHIQAF